MQYSAYISVPKIHFSAHITKYLPQFSAPGKYSLTKCGKQWVEQTMQPVDLYSLCQGWNTPLSCAQK